jgi:predicted dehydrogenase
VAGTAAGAALLPDFLGDLAYGQEKAAESPNDRPLVGVIGAGGQGRGIMHRAMEFGDIAGIADVQRQHAEKGREESGGKAEIYEDYRQLLDRNDISIILIGTPDHWHTKPVVDAMRAGKDVYCEKPLTLTVAEGQLIQKVAKETGRILQVGTQQRSDNAQALFLRAVATVKSGQLGKMQKVLVSLPRSTATGGPFEAKPVPEGLNWDKWLGQAPMVDFCPERAHFQFRWWYEYSGGIVTDWGAHHMDIAQWALGVDRSGPLSVDGSKTELPNIPNGYNTPPNPTIVYVYDNEIELEVTIGNEGILFTGEKGRIYCNRGRITGAPIEAQDADEKLKAQINEIMEKTYPGKPGNHMRNFFEAVKARTQPVSDAESQHRSVSACHIGNISIRLGRKLTWDAAAEKFVGDDEANGMLSREQRAGYEVV